MSVHLKLFPFLSCSFPFSGDSVDIYDYSKDFHLSLKSLFLLFEQTFISSTSTIRF